MGKSASQPKAGACSFLFYECFLARNKKCKSAEDWSTVF